MNEIRQQSIIGMILLFLLISTRVFAYDTVIDGLRYEWKSQHNSVGEIIWVIGYTSIINENLIIPYTLKWVSRLP